MFVIEKMNQIYGEGVIKFISKSNYAKLPIKVHFKERKTYAFFTMNGNDYIDGPMKMIHWQNNKLKKGVK